MAATPRAAMLAMLLLPVLSAAQEPPDGYPPAPPGHYRGMRPPPGHGEGPPPGERPPEAVQLELYGTRFKARYGEARQRAERLKALARTYMDPEDPAALMRERARLRSELEADLSELESTAGGFKEALQSLMMHVRQFRPGTEGLFKPYGNAGQRMGAALDELRGQLEEEEARYAEADIPGNLRRRRLMLAASAAAVLAALAGGFYFLQKRLVAAAVQDITTRTLQSASVTPPAVTPQVVTDAPGRVVGDNFRIEERVGEGGMGVVYRATDLTLRRAVAIKRMRDEIMTEPAQLELFLNEARLVASLKHPNIIEILSIVKEPGRLYLVFELVEGRSLHEWIRLNGRLGLKPAQSVLYQVSQALDHAHERKIVHRDLKPANVMVDARGVAKVMDFGIAHQAQRTLATVTHTDRAGTPAYMAPEQELGESSRAADVFAAGVCLYEMATGRLPFNGPNFLAQKREMHYMPPSTVVPGLPPALDRVVASALAPDPARRYPTAGDLARDLMTL
ncbi:MAG: serine/threonine protein kinase [Elusimicrobia bacterium]|nr:serine/threonine protein kinase [Elusimicrobiota bacterium]